MTRGIHWFRNDLRLRDNTALRELAARADEWLPVFVLDPRVLGSQQAGASRTRFLLDCLRRLADDLDQRATPLLVREGLPEEVLPKLLLETGAHILSFNEDATPFAVRRDERVQNAVERQGGEVLKRLDHVVFRASEIRTRTGGPYSVYTPYLRTWWARWHQEPRLPAASFRLPTPIPGIAADAIPEPEDLGLLPDRRRLPTGGERAARRRLERFLEAAAGRYHEDRDRPDLAGTSRLSAYLRFGAISVRQCFASAQEAIEANPGVQRGVEKWLDELIWRDFYSAVLEDNPRVLRENHRSEYDAIEWNHDPTAFQAWCEGQTGFPIVDAGMRQLRETGWMHNRVRMIVASFLTKDLLIDWREGERFFFEQLVDGDPASNNGGWQWAASTGTDAQPYFRIFNPAAQARRWDPEGRYVRHWIPELRDVSSASIHALSGSALAPGYPAPIVDHAKRRALALARFRDARHDGVRA